MTSVVLAISYSPQRAPTRVVPDSSSARVHWSGLLGIYTLQSSHPQTTPPHPLPGKDDCARAVSAAFRSISRNPFAHGFEALPHHVGVFRIEVITFMGVIHILQVFIDPWFIRETDGPHVSLVNRCDSSVSADFAVVCCPNPSFNGFVFFIQMRQGLITLMDGLT